MIQLFPSVFNDPVNIYRQLLMVSASPTSALAQNQCHRPNRVGQQRFQITLANRCYISLTVNAA